jgi:hypothetical protein
MRECCILLVMTITARFASTCRNCRQPINVGDKIEWARGTASTHTTCPTYSGRAEVNQAIGSLQAASAVTTRGADCEHPQFHRSDCVCAKSFPVGTDADDRSYDAWTAFLATRPSLTIEDRGVYILADQRIVKLQANRAGTGFYPKLWSETADRLLETGEVINADYRYIEDYTERAALLDAVRTSGRKMDLAEAKAFLVRYGRCARCGLHLVAAKSVAAGLGPKCIKYFASVDAALAAEAPAPVAASLGSGIEGPAYDSPAADYPRIDADTDDVGEVGSWLARKGYARSRWTRSSDDDLAAAAGLGRDADY